MIAKIEDKRTRNKSKVRAIREKSKPGCTHFWIIESPSGSTSKGMCRYCGAVKEFMNDPPSLFYPGTFSQGEILDAREAGEDELG